MKINNFDVLKDGGSIKFETEMGIYYLDNRLGSSTTNKFYRNYPDEPDSYMFENSLFIVDIIEGLQDYKNDFYKDQIKNFIEQFSNLPKKEIVYIDMDGVVVDYYSAAQGLTDAQKKEQGFFEKMPQIKGAIDGFKKLAEKYNVFFASTAPWSNIYSLSEKRFWVDANLAEYAFKKLILTHNKSLLKGKCLIDDRTKNGAGEFEGELILFGSEKFPNWNSVIKYLMYE